MSDSIYKTVSIAKLLQDKINTINLPNAEGTKPNSELVLSFSFVRGTHGYIEKVVHQINGCYEKGWYDGCSVLIRKLVETLIIEVFEKYDISNKIKNSNGNYFPLKELINKILAEPTWNLSRDTKNSLKKMKKIGDRSAHNRRYIAHRSDIDNNIDNLRVTTQEFIYLADLK